MAIEKQRNKIHDKKKGKGERIITYFMMGVIIFAVLALGFTVKALFFPVGENMNVNEASHSSNPMGPRLRRMSFTAFDTQLAKEIMDADGDGLCDVCGMGLDFCIENGQLQCTMGQTSDKFPIGILGAQHIHADWKMYINGEPLDEALLESLAMDMSSINNPMTSSFIHLDKGAPPPEKTGDVLHMHATGVPLWIFFESVGMKFEKDCFTIDTGEGYCNDGKNSLKFYVNGKPSTEFEDYVFHDNDKILISYGLVNEDVTQQFFSISSFADNH